MKVDEYLEKKKELEEAENKAGEIRKSLRAEKKEALKERFDKYNFLHKLKPWTRSDILLVIFMMVLFLVAYNHGGAVTNDNEEGFFGGIFGFLVKDKDVGSDPNINADVDDTENSGDTNGELSDNSGDSVDSSDSGSENSAEDTSNEPEPIVIAFKMWAEYNDQEFSTIDLEGTDTLIYYIQIQNQESFEITCEGYSYRGGEQDDYSNFDVDANEMYSMFMRIVAGNDTSVISKQELTCYESGNTISDGTEKQLLVNINFN